MYRCARYEAGGISSRASLLCVGTAVHFSCGFIFRFAGGPFAKVTDRSACCAHCCRGCGLRGRGRHCVGSAESSIACGEFVVGHADFIIRCRRNGSRERRHGHRNGCRIGFGRSLAHDDDPEFRARVAICTEHGQSSDRHRASRARCKRKHAGSLYRDHREHREHDHRSSANDDHGREPAVRLVLSRIL